MGTGNEWEWARNVLFLSAPAENQGGPAAERAAAQRGFQKPPLSWRSPGRLLARLHLFAGFHGLLNMNWGKRKRGALKVGLLPRGRDPKHRERPGTFCSIEEITGLAQGRVRLPRRAEGCGRSGRRSVAWPWYQKGTCCALTTELHGLALARRGAARGALGQHDVEFASLTHPS